MSEPRRLLEEGGNDLERSLLRSARLDAPPPAARRKTMLALGLAGGVGAAVTATTATSTATAALKASGTLGGGLLKWIGLGAFGGLAVVGATTLVAPRLAPAPPPAIVTAPITMAEPKPSVPPPPPPAPAPPPSEETPPPSSEEAAPRPTAATAARPAPTSLTEEVASLDTAREALAAGDASRALRALDDHARKFPGGLLGPEATVLRIEALALRGDRAAATRLGKAFLDAHPHSPHANRLRSLLGLDPPPAP
jgi:hypothetical protein